MYSSDMPSALNIFSQQLSESRCFLSYFTDGVTEAFGKEELKDALWK